MPPRATVVLALVLAALYLLARIVAPGALPARSPAVRYAAVATMFALGAYSLAVDGRAVILVVAVAMAAYEATIGRRRPT